MRNRRRQETMAAWIMAVVAAFAFAATVDAAFLGSSPAVSSSRISRHMEGIRTATAHQKQPIVLPSSQSQSCLLAAASVQEKDDEQVQQPSTFPTARTRRAWAKDKFDLETAMFCAGLAFDSYVEPPSNSSRWERGSKGMDVAFMSNAFTRSLYKGLVQITPQSVQGLPDEEDALESLATGGGTDAYVTVAAIEGQWEEDIQLLEKEQYHAGIRDLSGAAHVGRSSTAWSNVNENASKNQKRKTGKAPAYHIRSGWGRYGQAVWTEDEEPFYLYVQDPATARLVFTVMDDDVVGDGDAIGSAHKRLAELIPQAKLKYNEFVDSLKGEALEKLKTKDLAEIDLDSELAKVNLGARTWEGTIKLTSKPRKKDKKGQVALGVAAGAALAGPLGAAVGGAMANMYEGDVRGHIDLKLSYLPIPNTPVKRKKYTVFGGLPGINWGTLYEKFLEKTGSNPQQLTADQESEQADPEDNHASRAFPGHLQFNDLEQCFFINHQETGGCCVVYRSLEKKLLVVSFRGTCVPKDLFTDVLLVQDAWVDGEDVKNPEVAKVHSGFRTSMESISRRLKELVLATVAPGDDISDYDMLITGHSLGGALSTLFTADIGEYGIDAGRALPQLEESDDWWKSITNTIMGQKGKQQSGKKGPPRPKSLRMYNFGSPRVGNDVFAQRFDSLLDDGRIDQAYRIVNGDDIVTRVPRTTNAIVGSVNYEHAGRTVLVSTEAKETTGTESLAPAVWVEGESDESKCPVRDMDFVFNSPLAEGTLLGDIFQSASQGEEKDTLGKLSGFMSKVSDRMKTLKASDLASVVGIDREFSERELNIINSFAKGKALANHMEDDYYAAMGRACGLKAVVGEEIIVAEATGAISSD